MFTQPAGLMPEGEWLAHGVAVWKLSKSRTIGLESELQNTVPRVALRVRPGVGFVFDELGEDSIGTHEPSDPTTAEGDGGVGS